MKLNLLYLSLYLLFTNYTKSIECEMNKDSGFACVCKTNQNNCTTPIEGIPDLNPSDVLIYQTSKASSKRLEQTLLRNALQEKPDTQTPWNTYEFRINTKTTFQSIVGFGGALTDAAFVNLNLLEDKNKQEILESYYGATGIQYSVGRIPIGSTDFSLQVYSYCDKQNDTKLETFSINVDRSELTGYKLQNSKAIIQLARDSGRDLKLFASPWAPPGWMTDTGEVIHNPRLSKDDQIQRSYVEYLKRFFEEYEKEGIHFWGMTAQNEPDGNLGQWQSLRFSPEEYRDFVRDHLGLVLKTRFPKLKIMMHDDQR